MSVTDTDYVLVIEGAVMYGFTGTKCVQFALQVMGIDVCGIVPDHFSVHFHYKHYSSVQYSVEELEKTYATLKANGLHKKFTHVLTGYHEKTEILEATVKIIKDLKACNPDIIYICDPVIGDNGAYFQCMPVELRHIYREILVPMATITTPNQFELESISGVKINSVDDALKAAERVHDKGVEIVIMTSCTLDNKDIFTTIGSRRRNGKQEAYRIDYPHIDANLVGTGDLFTGSFTGLIRKTDDMKTSLEKTIAIMQIVCQRTYRDAIARAGPGNPLTPDLIELRVAQCASFIMNPHVTYESTKLL